MCISFFSVTIMKNVRPPEANASCMALSKASTPDASWCIIITLLLMFCAERWS